jgi:hypothetical protein
MSFIERRTARQSLGACSLPTSRKNEILACGPKACTSFMSISISYPDFHDFLSDTLSVCHPFLAPFKNKSAKSLARKGDIWDLYRIKRGVR